MKKNEPTWNDDQPIYRQITDMIIGRILDGTYLEAQLLPSVRDVTEEFDVSPLTAAKVFQELDKEGLTIKRRGIGVEVKKGSHTGLLKREQRKFLDKEWPELQERLKRMQIDIKDLLESL